jgi:hypothetical protein
MNTIEPGEGDCWPACLAHLFEVPFETVAHLGCYRPKNWEKRTRKWLRARGLTVIDVQRIGDRTWSIFQPPDGMLVIASGLRTGDGAAHCNVVRIHSNPKTLRFETVYAPGGDLRTITSLSFFPKLFLTDEKQKS